MKLHLGIVVFAFAFSIGCHSKKEVEIPVNVLPREKMVSVLVKINLLEASIDLKSVQDNKTNPNAPYFDPLKEEKITAEQYNKSFDFYSHHPVLMDSIYDDVLDELSKRKAEEMKR
ncbi:MAG: DUF4296 domain-containing protein [Bacteroidia bacterium]